MERTLSILSDKIDLTTSEPPTENIINLDLDANDDVSIVLDKNQQVTAALIELQTYNDILDTPIPEPMKEMLKQNSMKSPNQNSVNTGTIPKRPNTSEKSIEDDESFLGSRPTKHFSS